MSIQRLLVNGLDITNTGMQFGTKELNAYVEAGFWDDFDFWQRNFGVYSIMKMNKKFKYRIVSFRGSPLNLQKMVSCVYENGCIVNEQRTDLTPDLAYSKCTWCDDDLIDSAFEHTRNYNNNGTITLDAHGQKRFTLMVNEITRNVGLAVRGNVSTGGFYETTGVDYDFSTSSIEERVLFGKTTSSTKGWIPQAKEYAVANGADWMDFPEGDISSFTGSNFTTDGYSGSVVAILDEILRKAPEQLNELVNEGEQEVRGRTIAPIIIASNVWWNAIVQEYNQQSDDATVNERKITREKIGKKNVYYYRGLVPIVHHKEAGTFDKFTTGKTNILGFTVTGNIQFGGNFDTIAQDKVTGFRPGLITSFNNDAGSDRFGQWTMLTQVLLKAAIADPELWSGMISYSKPDPASGPTAVTIV